MWFHPGERLGIQVKYIVKLTQLVGLAHENIDLLVKSYSGVLQSADWRDTLGRHGATPLETIQIKDEEVVQPELAVASTEHIHLVVNDTRRVELSHWRLTSDYAGYVET